jgi:HlyD family secretion protein
MRQFRPDLKPTPVRLTEVTRGDLMRTVSVPGQIEPRTKVEISAQVSARIIALPFRAGQQVRKGDVICRLDADDLAAALDSARAQLRGEEARLTGARASLENARLELNRRRELHATRDVSKAELDAAEAEFLRAQASLQSSEAAIEAARANISRAEKDLSNTVMTAPFDGVITRLDAEIGELVVVGTLNNPGSVFMEIADLSVMLLKARVDEANITRVKEGQKALVYVNALQDTALEGVVEHVGLKRMDDREGNRYFEADILITLPEGLLLRQGLTANAEIQVETFRDVLKVPSQAVFTRNLDDLPLEVTRDNPHVDNTKRSARVVFVVRDGKAVARPVQVGASDLTDTVVMAGLEAGERVISGPYKILTTLRHGQIVEDQDAAPAVAPGASAGTASAGTQPRSDGQP